MNQNNYLKCAFLVCMAKQTQIHVQRPRGTKTLSLTEQRRGEGEATWGGDSTAAEGTVPPCCH